MGGLEDRSPQYREVPQDIKHSGKMYTDFPAQLSVNICISFIHNCIEEITFRPTIDKVGLPHISLSRHRILLNSRPTVHKLYCGGYLKHAQAYFSLYNKTYKS